MVGTLKVGRMMLGCLSASMLVCSLMLSSQAWALDQNSEIDRLDNEASQIVNTLGRDRGGYKSSLPALQKYQAEQEDESGMKVQLIPAHKSKRSS